LLKLAGLVNNRNAPDGCWIKLALRNPWLFRNEMMQWSQYSMLLDDDSHKLYLKDEIVEVTKVATSDDVVVMTETLQSE
jgi:hypothetical protein